MTDQATNEPSVSDATYETIRYEMSGEVAEVTMNRSGSMNAMSATMRRELAHAFRRAGREARALLITGAPPEPGASGRAAFCAGQDLGDVRESDLERILLDEYRPMLEALIEAPIPSVAAVNGVAAGAGMHLALAADIVYAARSARFVAPFARIGLIPAGAGSYLLPRLIGPARAKAMTLLGHPVDAETARDWGMILGVEEDATLLARARDVAARLASGPTRALALTKQALEKSLENGFVEQLELEARLQGEAGRTRDYQEGVAAFLEKRPPRFEGR